MQYTMLYEDEILQYAWMGSKMHRACEISQHDGITMVRRAVHFSTATNEHVHTQRHRSLYFTKRRFHL
jgi:hypothetical protein